MRRPRLGLHSTRPIFVLTPQHLNPTRNQLRQPCNDLSAKQHLANVAHVEHVQNTAQIWSTAAAPPRVMGIDNQTMLDRASDRLASFLQFHPIDERLVHAICDAASKGCREIVLLDLPNRNWING